VDDMGWKNKVLDGKGAKYHYRHPQEDELKDTLKPCPHCGAKAELRIREMNNDGGKRCSYLVCCSNECSGQTAYRVNLPTAVEMWNRRDLPKS
jgi:hypothetical protein